MWGAGDGAWAQPGVRGSWRACLTPTLRGGAGDCACLIVQPGVRVRLPGAPLQAVPEPQERDPRLWAWPGAQEAAELPTPPGNAAEGRHGDPCPEAPGDRYSWLF